MHVSLRLATPTTSDTADGLSQRCGETAANQADADDYQSVDDHGLITAPFPPCNVEAPLASALEHAHRVRAQNLEIRYPLANFVLAPPRPVSVMWPRKSIKNT